eukprot:g5447.t1
MTASLIRHFGKTKRPRYAAGKKFPKDKTTRETGVTESGRRVKHFDELKFYHAKNRHGQNQTLVDSRRRDIDFFNPITGGYDRDPRSRYEDSDSGGDSLDDDEAAAFADFTDTDDEDIYFGGGNDQDGDYDDDGNELRPKREQSDSRNWADPDPIAIDQIDDDTDLDEDEREFNEVFGKSNRRNSKQRMESKRSSNFDDSDQMSKSRTRRDQRPDPEIGIDFKSFTERFRNKSGESKPVHKKDFSAEEFLKDSDGDDMGSDFDEEKELKAGEEEMEEFNDVFEMMRDYDRPSKHSRVIPVTEKMASARKQLEMYQKEEYSSDDIEIPNAQDPKLQREITEEHEQNMKRLKATPGGRKTLKSITEPFKNLDDFPPCGKELYENALGPNPGSKSKPRPLKVPSVGFVDRDNPLSSAAKGRRRSDSWRTLNLDFDDSMNSKDNTGTVYSDLKSKRKNDEKQSRIIEKQHKDFRGRPPYGGRGVRHLSTSARTNEFRDWCEESVAMRYAKKLKTRTRVAQRRELDKSTALRKYWDSFPNDQVIEEAVKAIRPQLRHHGCLYVAMLGNKNIVCGIRAPEETIRGTERTVDQFESHHGKEFVKLDRASFRRLVQRGEIVTGGPPTGVKIQTPATDWTGTNW